MKKLMLPVILMAVISGLVSCGETLTEAQANDLADAYSYTANSYTSSVQRQTERLMGDFMARGITPEEYLQANGDRALTSEVTLSGTDYKQEGTVQWTIRTSVSLLTMTASAKITCIYENYHHRFTNAEGDIKEVIYNGEQIIEVSGYLNIFTLEAGLKYVNRNGSGFTIDYDGVTGTSIYNVKFQIKATATTNTAKADISLKGFVNNRSIDKKLSWMLHI